MNEDSLECHVNNFVRFNILVLPTYTAILFALIALVILGAALASLLPGSQLWWPLILLPLLLLPLRDFLHGPDREKRRHSLRQINESEEPLQSALDDLSQILNLHPPQILISDQHVPTNAFGTFRRAFVMVGTFPGELLAQDVVADDAQISGPARTLLAHELAHFANGDVHRAAFSRSLLKMTTLFALASLWLSFTLVAIMVEIGPEIVRAEFWRGLSQLLPIPGLDLTWIRDLLEANNPGIFQRIGDPSAKGTWAYFIFYLANTYLPFLLATPVLYFFFWRKLMRVREFYADARAADLMGSARVVEDAMILNQALSAVPNIETTAQTSFRQKAQVFSVRVQRFSFLSYHPNQQDRRRALDDPLTISSPAWNVAVWTGVAVLLLELILRNSLTLPYLWQPGAHLPLITASLVFSLWLLPGLCKGRRDGYQLRTILLLAVLFVLVKLSLNFLDGVFVFGAWISGGLDSVGGIVDVYLRSMLGAYGATMAPIVGPGFDWPQIIDWHIVRPIAYYLFFALPLLIATLAADVWLKGKVLTWYRLGERIKSVFWAIIIVLVALQLLILIPVGNRLFFPFFYETTGLISYLSVLLGVLLLLGSGTAFGIWHRRLARLCPQCQTSIGGNFVLGKHCPQCGARLHAWLLARY